MGTADTGTIAVGNEFTCPDCGTVLQQVEPESFAILASGQWLRLVSALRPAQATRQDYEHLAHALRSANERGDTPEEIARRI